MKTLNDKGLRIIEGENRTEIGKGICKEMMKGALPLFFEDKEGEVCLVSADNEFVYFEKKDIQESVMRLRELYEKFTLFTDDERHIMCHVFSDLDKVFGFKEEKK